MIPSEAGSPNPIFGYIPHSLFQFWLISLNASDVLATELQDNVRGSELNPDDIFQAVSSLHNRVEGSYEAISLIALASKHWQHPVLYPNNDAVRFR